MAARQPETKTMNNPYEADYPPEDLAKFDIHCKRDEDGVWSIWCPQWKCELHSKSLTREIVRLVAEIESNNECNASAKFWLAEVETFYGAQGEAMKLPGDEYHRRMAARRATT